MERTFTRRTMLSAMVAAQASFTAGCGQTRSRTNTEREPHSPTVTTAEPNTQHESNSPTSTEAESTTEQHDEMDELSFTTADTHRTQILHDGLALGSNRNHQARLLRSKDETKQIEIDRVDEDTREFLTQTNFDVENILVVQVRLPSSGIEYVVNKVGLANERIHVQSEYVIKPGPQDETIETELVKFSVPDNQSIEEVVIHTRNSPYHDQNGTTFTASD